MFYQPGKTPHNLPHDPFKSCVVPRPIGWISTLSPDGKIANLAPYSQFQNLTFDPPYVMFAANQTWEDNKKDTTYNAEQTGRFCWNMATYELRQAVNITAEAVPPEVDEFERANLTKITGELSDVPMVKESPVRFECEYYTTIRLPGNPPMGSVSVVIGKVVGVHIDEQAITNGKVDILKLRPIARCGYYEYTSITEVFEMIVPGDARMLRGLGGSAVGNAQTNEENKAKAQLKSDPVNNINVANGTNGESQP